MAQVYGTAQTITLCDYKLQERRHDTISQWTFDRRRHTRHRSTAAHRAKNGLGGTEGRLMAWLASLTAAACYSWCCCIRICCHRKPTCDMRIIHPEDIRLFTVNYACFGYLRSPCDIYFSPSASASVSSRCIFTLHCVSKK